MKEFYSVFDRVKSRYKENPINEALLCLPEPDGKVVIFGAGDVAELLLPFLERYQSRLFAYCDNHKTGIHPKNNVPIISPAELVAEHRDAVVIIAISSAEDSDTMYNQLIEFGFPQSRLFRSYGDVFMSLDDIEKNYLSGYEWAYGFFSDAESKSIILDRIKGYLFGFEMNPLPYQDIYFPENIGFELSGNEIFIDGGAYDGAIALDFVRRVNNNYDKIYAFEPDRINYQVARASLSAYPNVEVINAGLWRSGGELTFSAGLGQASHIDDNGANKVQTVSLDEMFRSSPDTEWPTFVKMDIEGAEHAAIEGAREIIDRKRPKLAISAYHKPEDIYDLPRLIHSINPDYKYALRHYTKGCLETVLYAF
jgi:FkbM family methyltransferase